MVEISAEGRAAIHEASTAMAGVRESLDELSESVAKLASKKDVVDAREEDAKKRKPWLIVLLVFILFGVIIAGLNTYILKKTLEQSQFNGRAAVLAQLTAENAKDAAKQAVVTNEILLECTTPSTEKDTHDCYERAQANQGTAIGQINAITMASAACTDLPKPLTIMEVRHCVRDVLDQSTAQDRELP